MAGFIWGANGQPLDQEETQREYEIANALQQQQQPVRSWAQGVSNLVGALTSRVHREWGDEANEANDEYSRDALAAALAPSVVAQSAPMSSAEAAPTSSPVAAALIPPSSGAEQNGAAAAKDIITAQFLDHMKQAESGGNPNAVSPKSSATGAFQFTNPTWTGLMRNHPELGLTADGRTDPTQSEAAAKQLASDNIAYLLAHGVSNPGEGAAYLAHFAGPSAAAQALTADPATPISSVLSPQQIAANPFTRDMTTGDLTNWANQKMGQTGATVQQPQQPAPQMAAYAGAPVAQTQQMPQLGALASLMSDPRANSQTRQVAGAMLSNVLQNNTLSQQEQIRQADPLYQAEINERNAQMQAYQQRMNAPQKPAYSQILSGPQAQQMGLDPSKAYQQGPDGKWQQIGGSGVNVTLNNGPTTGEFQKKSDDAAADRLGSYIQEGSAAPALIGQLQQLSDLSRSIGTGKGAQFMASVGPYAQALGVNVKGLDQTQAFNAIVDRMAPQMRPVGSGSSSDTDVRMFMNSLPQLSNTDRGNQIITGTMQALQQNKLQAADIASQAQRGQISWQDAESQIRKLPNPYEQFKKAHADLVPDGTDQSGPRTTSSGVKWSIR